MLETPRPAPPQLLQLVPDIIYVYRLSPPGFVYVTPSVTAVTGYTPEEHYADPAFGRRLVHPEDRPLLDEIAAAPDEDRVYRIRWRTRSGEEVVTAQRIRAVRDASGDITSLIGVSRPLTDRDPEWTIVAGDLRLDLAGQRATFAGRPLALTPSELQLLALLAAAERTVTREELVERLWGDYHEGGGRTVEVHVSNLRKKLLAASDGALRLRTVRGVGYRLVGLGGTGGRAQDALRPELDRALRLDSRDGASAESRP